MSYYGDKTESIDLYVKRTNYIDVIRSPEGIKPVLIEFITIEQQ